MSETSPAKAINKPRRPNLDAEYDALFRKLEDLEKQFPALATPNSPTQRVGGDAIDGFEKIAHVVKMLSIDDMFSDSEVEDFFHRLVKHLGNF